MFISGFLNLVCFSRFVLHWSGCHNNIPQIDGLNSRNWFSHSPGSQKSKIKIPVWLGFSEDSLLGLQADTFLAVSSCNFSSVGARGKRVGWRMSSLVSLPIKILILSEQSPTHHKVKWPHLSLITSLAAPSPNTGLVRVQSSTLNFERSQTCTLKSHLFHRIISVSFSWIWCEIYECMAKAEVMKIYPYVFFY